MMPVLQLAEMGSDSTARGGHGTFSYEQGGSLHAWGSQLWLKQAGSRQIVMALYRYTESVMVAKAASQL
jgi:hypothetical protein